MEKKKKSKTKFTKLSNNQSDNKLPDNNLPAIDFLPPLEIFLLSIPEKPVFPGMMLPYVFNSESYEKIFKDILEKKSSLLGIILEKPKKEENPYEFTFNSKSSKNSKEKTKDEIYSIGCLGKILNINNISPTQFQVVINFKLRFQIKHLVKKPDHYIAQVKYLEEMDEKDLITKSRKNEIKGYSVALISKIKELIKLNSVFTEEYKILISRYSSHSLSLFLNLLCSLLTIPNTSELQKLLEINDLKKKILLLLDFLHREVEVFKVKKKINQQIEEKISSQQRDFFLKEQLKYIKKELKIDSDEKHIIITKLLEKRKHLHLSEEAAKITDEELDKLKLYDSKSIEFGLVKNYLDLILSLPWEDKERKEINLDKAQKILDLHHFGLKKIKAKLLEFLAVEKLKKKSIGSILCFVGPPGVGKTSLGKSFAKAMGRKFYRFSVGGMRDEAEIKGHRRTYVGAMPGKIIQALKLAQEKDMVILIDEIDKITKSFQGDPSAALLEVLDPEQNQDFLDHYLDIRFDLSKILFITTANQLETIPDPLLDRMEIIQLTSYTLEEKINIAKKFLIPKQQKENSLTANDFSFTPHSIKDIIEYYSLEAGVRRLENNIKTLFRKIAFLKAIQSSKKKFKKVILTQELIEEYLDENRIKKPLNYKQPLVGVVCGLAWTPLGGATLYIEAISIEKKEKGFKLTGHLGKVMEESAQIAYSYVQSISSKLFPSQSTINFFEKNFIHLHVPSGAIPKDGPSAGITMATALASLALGKGIPSNYAMTGELTLSGKVLPIGGLQEKLLAAKKMNKTNIILPLENKNDAEKIPQSYLKGLSLFFVDHVHQVLEKTLKIK